MSEKPKIPDEIAAMSFEESLGGARADRRPGWKAVTSAWKNRSIFTTRGTQLKSHCEAKLRAAQEKIEKIVVGPGGEPVGVEPAGIE